MVRSIACTWRTEEWYDDDEGYNYVCPTEQVYITMIAERRKRKISQDICKSVRTYTEEWLFNTGATVHITPC
jgi:hypothetical protein